MSRYYPKIIKCIVCGAKRETFKHAKYCGRCAQQVKLMQMRGHAAGSRSGSQPKIRQTWAYVIKACEECNKDYVPTNGSQRFCVEKCIYANNIKTFGLKKANNLLTQRRSRRVQKKEPPPLKRIEIPPMQLQRLSPEQITRYWGRII